MAGRYNTQAWVTEITPICALQAAYIGVPKQGPYKVEHYRY